jgi:deoxycytidine triphosphate deaminase
MILSGLEIFKSLGKGITIEPFDERQLNPNSYNLRLHGELLVYTSRLLDMKAAQETERIVIPPEGLVLEPDRLYLGRTIEFTATECFVPMLEGRSSVRARDGRLRRRGIPGLLDARDILRSAGAGVSGRTHLPDLLPYDHGRF